MGSTRTPYGASRDALVEAAIRVVAREGLAGLSSRALAREAGVSHSAVNYHFDSIDGVLAAGLDRAYEHSVALMDSMNDLTDMFDLVLEEVSRESDVAAFQFEVLLAGRRRPELRPLVEKLYARYREWLAGCLKRLDVEDPEAIDVVLALVDGISYQLTALGPANLPTARVQIGAIMRILDTYRRVPT